LRQSGLLHTVPVWLIVAAVILVVGAGLSLAQPAGGEAGGTDAAKGETQSETRTETKTSKMTFLELLHKGGLQFMIPIGLCSVLGLTIIIERLFALRSSVVMPKTFLPGLKGVFRRDAKDRQAGLDYCTADGSPLSRVVAAGIRKLHKSEEAVERAIEDAGALEVDKLRRNLHLLYSVSAVAPMLGLLGTVWGMIDAFQITSMAEAGDDKAVGLATGIYTALVTTFAGLVVAIPVLVLYYYFLGRIDRSVHELNDVTAEFVDHYTAGEVLAPVDE